MSDGRGHEIDRWCLSAIIGTLYLTLMWADAGAQSLTMPRVLVSGTFSSWLSEPDSWSYESAFLGTARGSAGRLSPDGGWDLGVAVDIGRAVAGAFAATSAPILDLELRYGRDGFRLSEQLDTIHQGADRRYDLGTLTRQRLTTSLGTSFHLHRGTPRLVVSARLGLIDAQFHAFDVAVADPELPYAIGGALAITAGRGILWFNPLDVTLRCDLTRHAFLLAGARLDRLEAPLHWAVAGLAPATPVRDQLSVEAGVLRAGAGACW